MPGTRFKLKPESIAYSLSFTSPSMLALRLVPFGFDTCVLLAFIFQHRGVLARQTFSCNTSSPGPLLTCLRWIHFPSGASSLPFLPTILKGRVCIPEAYTPQSHGIGSRWPTVCCETWESKFKKKKFCHGFGMLCFSDGNRVFGVGL